MHHFLWYINMQKEKKTQSERENVVLMFCEHYFSTLKGVIMTLILNRIFLPANIYYWPASLTQTIWYLMYIHWLDMVCENWKQFFFSSVKKLKKPCSVNYFIFIFFVDSSILLLLFLFLFRPPDPIFFFFWKKSRKPDNKKNVGLMFM